MKERIKNYLEKMSQARERKFHKRAVVNVLLEDYPQFRGLDKQKLIDFCADFESGTREWREITRLNPHLRGSDYEDKDKLEQQYQINRGYEANYQQDIKQLGML